MLTFALYDRPGGTLLLDATPYLTALHAGTTVNGFGELQATLRLQLAGAYQLYRQSVMHAVIWSGGLTPIWEGRIEHAALLHGAQSSVRLIGYGYWRALSDVLITELWSAVNIRDWRILQPIERPDAFPDRFAISTDDGLRIAPRKGEVFGSTGGFKVCWAVYGIPSGATRGITTLTFDWRFIAPASWNAEIRSDTAIIFARTGDGGLQAGSETISIDPATSQLQALLFNFGADSANIFETGNIYFELRNVRVVTNLAAVNGRDIMRATVQTVATRNPTQLSASTDLIQLGASFDLRTFIATDITAMDVLTSIAVAGGPSGGQMEVAVWEGQRVVFRPLGSTAQSWYVDAAELNLEQSLDSVATSVYARYKDTRGRTLRTAVATDAAAVAQRGVSRSAMVSVDTATAAEANSARDTALAASATPAPTAMLRIARVYTATGAQMPVWSVRAGDTLTIRNLPLSLGADVDQVRTVRIARTSVDLFTNELSVELAAPPPSLPAIIASR